ncbi:Ctf8-domain-containing protein [Russula earlei]|uniref:Ctf8-domain-containing protein n=1 Tax=Russula earlei TaxID=71964 RepID=A0ACC0U201_9AGAM|nr:Ctf8-domain-containing protein [Russula earlei]
MILPVTLPLRSPPTGPVLPPALAQLGSSEFFLLELQGELQLSGDNRGQLVGRLTIDQDGKVKPTLRIGHHLLEGKIVSLPKPLALLQRARAPLPPAPLPDSSLVRNGDGDGGEDVDMRCHGSGDAEGRNDSSTPVATSYAIRTLIRKKIVFSNRPTPIVGLSAKVP